MHKYVYRVTEKNVDGCGGDATEFIHFARTLTREQEAIFAQALKEAKENAEEGSCTEDMINDALERFYKQTGISGAIKAAPYEGAFEF